MLFSHQTIVSDVSRTWRLGLRGKDVQLNELILGEGVAVLGCTECTPNRQEQEAYINATEYTPDTTRKCNSLFGLTPRAS